MEKRTKIIISASSLAAIIVIILMMTLFTPPQPTDPIPFIEPTPADENGEDEQGAAEDDHMEPLPELTPEVITDTTDQITETFSPTPDPIEPSAPTGPYTAALLVIAMLILGGTAALSVTLKRV